MDLLGLFKNSSEQHEIPAGEYIFTAGTPGDRMFVILEGEVDIKLGERTIATFGAGEIIGEMALIDARERSASALAKTNCRVAPVDQKRFLYMVQQTPFFSLHVMRVLAERIREMNLHSQQA